MLTWVLIIFVVALALAPLSHFVPTKRQKQVARMREQAAINGLFVEFRTPPGLAAPGAGRSAVTGDVIYYGRRLPAAVTQGISRTAWLPDEEGAWRSLKKRALPPPSLAHLTIQPVAASIDQESCGIYWRERVDAEDADAAVANICSVLDEWCSALVEG